MDVLVQVWDFLIKAAVAYVQTPEGQKELDDIEAAVADVIGDFATFDDDVPATRGAETITADKPVRNYKKRPVRGS